MNDTLKPSESCEQMMDRGPTICYPNEGWIGK